MSSTRNCRYQQPRDILLQQLNEIIRTYNRLFFAPWPSALKDILRAEAVVSFRDRAT